MNTTAMVQKGKALAVLDFLEVEKEFDRIEWAYLKTVRWIIFQEMVGIALQRSSCNDGYGRV